MTRYLPDGIDDFELLQANPEIFYVDKTALLPNLFSRPHGGSHIFLARPRRFGKTLLVSTLEALFQGKRELFASTWIGKEGNWDWERNHFPVLRLNLDLKHFGDVAHLQAQLADDLYITAMTHGITLKVQSAPSVMLMELIARISIEAGTRIVLLVDEYDTPITEKIGCPTIADGVLDLMRSIYGTLKKASRYIQYTFVTGITRFARTGLFSGANQLTDLSFRRHFSTLLGFTEEELYRDPDLATLIVQAAQNLGCDVAELYGALGIHYNGYQFSRSAQPVFNPYSLCGCLNILNAPSEVSLWSLDRLPSFWAESGTPHVLLDILKAQSRSEGISLVDDDPEAVEQTKLNIKQPGLAPLMYQSGYLTRKSRASRTSGDPEEYLDFPNREVAQAFDTHVREWIREQATEWSKDLSGLRLELLQTLQMALTRRDPDALKHVVSMHIRSLPFDLHSLPPSARSVAHYEVFYQALMHSLFSHLRQHVQSEYHTVAGSADIAVYTDKHAFIFELKVSENAETALRQALPHTYIARFQNLDLSVTAFGLQFDTARRSVLDCRKWELGVYDVGTGRWQHEPFAMPLCELSSLPTQERNHLAKSLAFAGSDPGSK